MIKLLDFPLNRRRLEFRISYFIIGVVRKMSYIHSTHLIYLVCHQDQLSFESLHWWFRLRDALPPPWVISPRETVPVRLHYLQLIIRYAAYALVLFCLRHPFPLSRISILSFSYSLLFNFWVAINSDLWYGVSWIGASIESVLLLLRIAILPLPTFLVAVAVRRRVLIDMSRCFAYCNLHYCN